MAIPGFQDLMLPMLELLDDGKAQKISSVVDCLAIRLGLTPAEQAALLPSGKQSTFANRTHWAATYLVKSGILERPSRGWVRLTDRGRQVLAENPKRIDLSYLMRYPEIVEFRGTSRTSHPENPTELSATESPEELLEESYLSLRNQLADDLLAAVRRGTPEFFERLVVDLLIAMGYGGSRSSVIQAVGRSGDEGIDGVINEDKLGLDIVYIQAKRWSGPVGRPVVQGFTGSLEGKRASKGVLITNSSFTREAVEFVQLVGKRIVLIDGNDLVNHMIDHDVGVVPQISYVVKRIDSDYFEEV